MRDAMIVRRPNGAGDGIEHFHHLVVQSITPSMSLNNELTFNVIQY